MVRLYSDVVANEPREWTVFENEHRNRSKTKSKFNGRSTLFKREDKYILKATYGMLGQLWFFSPCTLPAPAFPFFWHFLQEPRIPSGTVWDTNPARSSSYKDLFTWWIKYELWFKVICINMVKEAQAIQTNLFVYARFPSRNIPSDSQETSVQTYTHVYSLEVKMIEILTDLNLKWKWGNENIRQFLVRILCSSPNVINY